MDELFNLFKILDFECLCSIESKHSILDYAYGKIMDNKEEYRFEIAKGIKNKIHFYFIKDNKTLYHAPYSIYEVKEFIKTQFQKELRNYKIQKLLSDD